MSTSHTNREADANAMAAGANKKRVDTTDQAEFRHYCRDWLKQNRPAPPSVRLPQSPGEIANLEQLDYACSWQNAAYNAGLVGCDYPTEYGGGGHKDFQHIANEEMQLAGTPYFPSPVGLRIAAPTLLYHGQDALKKAVLPKLFSGEEIWCQGFSEPGAGSDLASAQTFAEKSGDKWIINGHKVWTSMAQFASWMILLCRTSKDHKYNGLSFFVVPIKSALDKGVTVRPLIKMSGETGFNEVIFENLEIDDAYRCGEIGSGWQVAQTALLHERGGGKLVAPKGGRAYQDSNESKRLIDAEALIRLAQTSEQDGRPASECPIIRDKIMRMVIAQEGIQQLRRRDRVTGLTDHPNRLQLQKKLISSEFTQNIAELALEIAGPGSTLSIGDKNAPFSGAWPMAYMGSFGSTIAAGTSQIQRNILGERILGLPKTK